MLSQSFDTIRLRESILRSWVTSFALLVLLQLGWLINESAGSLCMREIQIFSVVISLAYLLPIFFVAPRHKRQYLKIIASHRRNGSADRGVENIYNFCAFLIIIFTIYASIRISMNSCAV
jgi:hypothetical protein